MIAAVLFAAAVAGADAAQEFVLIAEAHRTLQRYDLAIEVTFPEGSPIPPVTAGVRRVDAKRELRTFGDLTILETPEWRVAVDAGDRVIVVGRRDGPEPAASATPPPQTPAETLASWLSSGNSILGGDVVPEGRRWQVVPASGAGTRADFVVDPHTRLLRRLEYESRDQSGVPVRVAIRYTWRDATHLRPDDFEVSRFIVVDGSVVRPSDNYAGFRILRSDATR